MGGGIRDNTEIETFQSWFQLSETSPDGTKQQSKLIYSVVTYTIVREVKTG